MTYIRYKRTKTMEIIETPIFTRELKANAVPDDDYRDLQIQLVANPDSGDLIQGTGGARKIRMKGKGGGKSGGFRIIYYWKKTTNNIFMLLIYPKGKQDDLTSDQKKSLKRVIEEI